MIKNNAASQGSFEEKTENPKLTQTERIIQALEAEILNGDIAPGQRLDEVTLSERFAVSRTPVREALRALATTGLVVLKPRIGAVVARPTVSEVMEIFELVGELEAVASRLACERMTDFHADQIAGAYQACCEAANSNDAALYMDRNDAFHHAIHVAADNRALADQITQLGKRLTPYRRFITFRPDRRETAEKEHEALALALKNRDGKAAAQAMNDHVRMLADDALILARSLKL
ncbi:GntR family transcriptional regulator [Roseovarius sp. ZX-A-9]|uniref:GntR family transcriptional regulator n=1 Tax=Roseovarius sp. ZX-A-9 TaxID=3014783 RepID=UPI00232C99C2|nr:GntR family transcriptional regulator [Roseovarius sp. ZX-A-9]